MMGHVGDIGNARTRLHHIESDLLAVQHFTVDALLKRLSLDTKSILDLLMFSFKSFEGTVLQTSSSIPSISCTSLQSESSLFNGTASGAVHIEVRSSS